MKRIKYGKSGDQSQQSVLVSRTAFETVKGSVEIKLINDNEFQVVLQGTNEVLLSGTANGPIVLRRKAKDALLTLVSENQFQPETRKKNTEATVQA